MDGAAAAAMACVTYQLFGHWVVPLALVPLWLVCLLGQGVYDGPDLPTAGGEEVRRVIRAAGVAAAVAGAAWWFTADGQVLHDALFTVTLTAALTIACRQGRRLLRGQAGVPCARRVLVVGPSRSAADVIAKLSRSRNRGQQVVGACLTDPAHADRVTAHGLPVLGGPDDTLDAVRHSDADTVVALPHARLGAAGLRELTWQVKEGGAEILLAPVLADVASWRVRVWTAAGLPLLHIRAPSQSGPAYLVKALADRVLAVLGLVLVSPLMAVIALLVRIDSPGPAFFRQRRLGRGGREFKMVKFRSMRQGAEDRDAELASLNQYDDQELFFKIVNDPRVTRLGSFLRRYSLDELPQLFNVAAGTMSLVGPRPLPSRTVSACTDAIRRRMQVKPGMTGLWQVSGRSALSGEQRLDFDLLYVENWSLGLDLRILLRTASVVIRGTGAY
ncbi:sugar transferase [Streptomyces sp. NPDC000070]|uniref:sugar transferase n=1 Tax=Streptomyces sp. NPDC000070 TaxID=3154240 RepID=UPI0033187289